MAHRRQIKLVLKGKPTLEGANYFDMQRDPCIKDGMLVHFDDGDEVAVSTEDDEVRFLLISGKPILEPVAW